MILKEPKEIITNFQVNSYKDMEFADEIEYSATFGTYKKALKYYKQEVKNANGQYFVEMKHNIEIIYNDKNSYETEEMTICHNSQN